MRRLSVVAVAVATVRAHQWARVGKSGGPRRLGTPLPNLPKMAPGRVSPGAPVVGPGGLDAGLG